MKFRMYNIKIRIICFRIGVDRMAANKYLIELQNITNNSLYIVGEYVRNYFLNIKTTKLDIFIKDDPLIVSREFAEIFKGIFIHPREDENRVIVKIQNDGDSDDLVFSFTSLNNKSIIDILKDGDFTINSMAAPIVDGRVDFDNIIDPYNGKEDIKTGIVREISEEVYEKDPIKMIKAAGLMAELEFDISDKTLEYIKIHSEKLYKISHKEATKELFKILDCNKAHYYFNIMDKYMNILNKIFPEIEPMKEVGKCKYHVVDAWTHSLYTMKIIESIIYADGYFEKHLREAYEDHMSKIYADGHTRIQLIKLAALFHDIGKPRARWVDETGRVRFRGHEIVGEEIVSNISDRLKLDIKEKEYLSKIVKEHMWPLTLYIKNDVSGKALYDLFKKFGENTLDIILIGLADIISTRQLLNPHEEMGMYKVHAEYLANNYLTRFKNIEDISGIINHKDIYNNYGIEDKRVIDEIIDSIKRAIFLGKIPLEKNRIYNYISENLL